MISHISKILHKSKELKKYYSLADCGKNASLAVATSARPLIVASDFTHRNKSILVIVAGDKNARAFANELRIFLDITQVVEYKNNLFGDDEKFNGSVFYALSILKQAKQKIVVASASSILRKISDSACENLEPLFIKVGKEYKYDDILDKLKQYGYVRLAAIDGPGTFSVAGGTIDIFPSQLNYPVRIDFFGDEVEEIRRIIQSTGQTIKQLDSIDVFSATEPKDFNKTLMLQEILHDNVVVYMDEPRAILDDMRNYYASLGKSIKMSKADKNLYYADPKNINFSKQQNIELVSIMRRGVNPDAKLTLKRPPRFNDEAQLKSNLTGYEIVSDYPTNISYLIPDAKLAIIARNSPRFINATKGEYFDQGKLEYIDITKITFPYKPGDYVVHSFYGIALFKDIVKREIAGSVRDYLLLEYADNDKLYVPIEQFGRITKYVGPQGFKPKVTRLGTAD